MVRDGLELGRPPIPPEREAPVLGRRTEPVRDGPLPERLTEVPGERYEGGRLTAPVRVEFARGWLTRELPGDDRGTVLVSVGPVPARPIVAVRLEVAGGR